MMARASDQVNDLGKKLMSSLTAKASRKVFFSTLSRLLQEHFHFDRLCINLYDHQGEMLTYFTAAEGAIVSTLSPVRPAEASSTVAGHVIATRKPVVITDFAQYFSESSVHPIAEAGLKATMAFPLMLDNDIIATLHCSFAQAPEDIYGITEFLLELSPVISTCLGAILSFEQIKYNEAHLQVSSLFPSDQEDRVICHSAPMRDVMRKIDAVAKLNIPILLLGETGTGKSLIAQDIHRRSLRNSGHFVKVNCPSLVQSLFESELFGHAKGAFTGAANKRIGRFELAHDGSLFLDEIAELTHEMQSKLLQVLEDSRFERVGESVSLAVDVRIIAATNVHIGEALSKGSLRADLFYRLSPCVIELPPLRDRYEDIPPLIASFSAQLALRLGLPPVVFSKNFMEPLLQYGWPGNVRELRNVVSKLIIHNSIYKQLDVPTVEKVLLESSSILSITAPFRASAENMPKPVKETSMAHFPSSHAPYTKKTLADVERKHILETLSHTNGVVAGPAGAAAILGIPRSTLQHRMQKLGITESGA